MVPANDTFGVVFNILWFSVLAYFAYLIFKSCVAPDRGVGGTPGNNGGRPRAGPPGGWGAGSGYSPDFNDSPPPPYSSPQYKDTSSPSSGAQGWSPGFWTGLGLGGLATTVWNSFSNPDAARRRQEQYDWEQGRRGAPPPVAPFPLGSRWSSNQASSSQASTSRAAPVWRGQQSESEGAGSSSNLGEARRSTAIASSNVR